MVMAMRVAGCRLSYFDAAMKLQDVGIYRDSLSFFTHRANLPRPSIPSPRGPLLTHPCASLFFYSIPLHSFSSNAPERGRR